MPDHACGPGVSTSVFGHEFHGGPVYPPIVLPLGRDNTTLQLSSKDVKELYRAFDTRAIHAI